MCGAHRLSETATDRYAVPKLRDLTCVEWSMESGNEPAVPGDEATVTGADGAPPPPSDAPAAAANEGPPGVGTDMPSRRTSILRASVIVRVLVVEFAIIFPEGV